MGHKHPTALAASLALPLAQKTLLLKFDFLYVGQPEHIQSFAFSSVSGTGFPKNVTRKTFWLILIIICDCFKPTTVAPTPSQNPTTTPTQSGAQTAVSQTGFNWTQLAIFAVLGILVALLVVVIAYMRRRIRVLETKF